VILHATDYAASRHVRVKLLQALDQPAVRAIAPPPQDAGQEPP
jgi:hypothetical protein